MKAIQRHWLWYILFIAFIVYCFYHFFNGQRGIVSFFELSKSQKKLQHEIAVLEQEKRALSSKIKALQSDSLDLDFIDEKARKDLNLHSKGEIVVFYE